MSELFPRVKFFRPGYRCEQVDKYFETAHEIYDSLEIEEMDSEAVRTVAFDIVHGGYQPDAVDAALDRLEKAFMHRRRSDFVAKHGRDAWMEQSAELATTLYGRLLRPAGERFAPAPKRGYNKEEVDALMERASDFFNAGKALAADDVRSATFSAARGNDAYEESSVDRYLIRLTEVLLSVE